MTARAAPTIALFPEASFGAALNCIGIAQALRERGARPVFICHPGFTGLFADYGFPEHHLPASAANGERPDTWQDFVRRHLPHFNLSAAGAARHLCRPDLGGDRRYGDRRGGGTPPIARRG